MQTSLATLLLLGLATSLAIAASTPKATNKNTDDTNTNKDDIDTTTKMDDTNTKDRNNTISIPTFKALHCPPGFAQNSSCSTKFCVVTCGNGQYFLKDIKTELYHLLPPARPEGLLEEGVEEQDKEEEEEGKDGEGKDEEDLEEEINEEENNKGEEDEDEVMSTDE